MFHKKIENKAHNFIYFVKKLKTPPLFYCIQTKMSAFTMNTVIERLEDEVEVLKAQKDELAQRLVGMVGQLQANRVASKEIEDDLRSQLRTVRLNYENACRDIGAMKDAEISKLNNELAAMKFSYQIVCDDREDCCNSNNYYRDELKKSNDSIAELLTKYIEAKDAIDDMKKSWIHSTAYTDNVLIQREAEIASLKKQLADQTNFMEKAIAHASQTESDLFTKNAELSSHIALVTEHCEHQSITIEAMKRDAENKNVVMATLDSQLALYKENMAAIAKANAYISDVLKEVEY